MTASSRNGTGRGSSWLPDAQTAQGERQALASALAARLGYRSTLPCHPYLFAQMHSSDDDDFDASNLLHDVEVSRHRAATFEGFNADRVPSTRLDVSLKRAEDQLEIAHGRRITPSILPPTNESDGALVKAFRSITDWWPDMAREMCATLDGIYFFKAERAIGFSDFRTHGAIFLRIQDIREHDRLVEELVHEASHVRLNAMMSQTAMVDSSNSQTFVTPLRREPRSGLGLLHQVFVLRRIVKLHELGGRAFPQQRAKEAMQQLNAALKTAEDISLTQHGVGMLSSLRN